MKIGKLSISDAAKKMALWKDNSDDYLEYELDKDYLKIRNKLKADFQKIPTAQKYTTDYSFGIFLYARLKEEGFTQRDASDDDKWRFLSLCVIPDIVAARWGKQHDIRYYKQSSRIWLKSIWWYIHLSWQGSVEDTVKVIKGNTTDQILQLVDRIGKNGYYIDTYRKIMFFYWKARQENLKVGESEFRKVMTLHTATCRSMEPDLYMNGPDGYARMLYEKIGVKL